MRVPKLRSLLQTLLPIALVVLLAGVPAQARPFGAGFQRAPGSNVQPDIEPGEGTPAITTPTAQTSVVATPVSFKGSGAEMVAIKAEGLPEGLTAKVASLSEWTVTGTATKLTPTKLVTVTVENKGGKEKAEASFDWTVDGIEDPGAQTAVLGSAVEIPVRGVGLAELSAVKGLPEGLALKEVSETEWEITGTPTKAGAGEVELTGANSAKAALPAVEFTFTVSEREAAPAPAPPTATGQLSVTPAGAFSAARSSCGGVAFSTGTVSTQWLLDGAPIAGADGASYIAPRIDDGHVLSCRETATASNGTATTLASAGAVVHEQPPQPAWPIGAASEHCSAALCMEDGTSAQTPPTRTYQLGRSWMAASQVRCVSAPWTSIAGGSTLSAVEGFVEAHAVTITLQRVTPAGVRTVASQRLAGLSSAADAIDGSLSGSPFAGQIAAGYGSEVFTKGELWPRLEPGSLGRPDRFAAGQGYLAYQLAATPGVKRSFQLLYNLTTADLGQRLRCVVAAEDGAPGSPTVASFTSAAYVVAKSASCGPRTVAHVGGPQPAVVLIGSRRCLEAESGLAEIGGAQSGVSSVAGRSSFMLECALATGCSGRLALVSAGHRLASVKLALRRNGGRLVSLKLDGQGRGRLRRSGAAGLPVALTLGGRLLLAARLLNVG